MVKGDIGTATGQDIIDLPLSGLLPRNVALDLAAAQPADITFFKRTAQWRTRQIPRRSNP